MSYLVNDVYGMYKCDSPDGICFMGAKRIWNVLANQFQFQLPEDLVDSLVDNFRGVSGRDIKELLKLTAKWCRQKNVTPSLDVFKTCAQFRGL